MRKWVLLACLTLFLGACQQTDSGKVKVGVLAPLTGNAAELGQHIQKGIDLANEHLDNKYQLIYEDDKCIDTAAALSAAQKFVTIDKVKFVIGPLCAPPYQAVSGYLNREGVAFMHTSGATPSFIANSGEFGIPGLSTSTYQENEVLAGFIYDGLKIKKMAVFVWNEEWAVEHGNGFVKHFKELGGEIVFDEKFNLEDTDFRTSILKIKQSGAEGVYIVALNFQNARIVKQFRQLYPELPIFGQFELEDPAFLDAAGGFADGVIYVYPKVDTFSPEVQQFITEFKTKYGSDPNYYVYVGYDALNLYDWGVGVCGLDPKCVISKILSLKNYLGIGGSISFADDKSILKEFEIRMFKNGKPVLYLS